MNTTLNTISQANLEAALSYYGVMQAKDFDTMVSYLSDDICLISPLAEINGKE
jgi:ketosteroid isomerase-like protein